MKKVRIVNITLLFALFGALWHVLWVVLISVPVATPLVDLILWLHFFKLPLYVEPPALPLAALLIGLTALGGGVFGFVLAVLWNAAVHWVSPGPDRHPVAERLPVRIVGADSE